MLRKKKKKKTATSPSKVNGKGGIRKGRRREERGHTIVHNF